MRSLLSRKIIHSLTFKLAIAFLMVGITGAMLVAVISWRRTQTAFSQFILNQEQRVLVNNLLQYYQAKGSWEGLESSSLPWIVRSQIDSRRVTRRAWERFLLLNLNRRVVYSTLSEQIGKLVSSSDIEKAYPLQVDQQVVGWLLLDPLPKEWIRDTPEEHFLSNVNRAILLGGLIATVIAITIGSLLAFTMTRSLHELTEATQEIAKGKLGKQVKVRSNDELGELARSFNQMSLDLARANQTRRQMTADIAHDLRSPLSVITGYAEALSDGKLPGTPEVYNILHLETKRLGHLIDDLRTLSLADAGELPLNPQMINPRTLLEQVVARHAVAAGQKGISLRVDIENNLPDLYVDIDRMAQVFDNLIFNAFRYTPEGGEVILSARAIPHAVEIQVQDNGSGIASQDLPHIFDRFYRGDVSRQQNGESGLGLAIAKSILTAHGGTINADSTPGHGATFTITLNPP